MVGKLNVIIFLDKIHGFPIVVG